MDARTAFETFFSGDDSETSFALKKVREDWFLDGFDVLKGLTLISIIKLNFPTRLTKKER